MIYIWDIINGTCLVKMTTHDETPDDFIYSSVYSLTKMTNNILISGSNLGYIVFNFYFYPHNII